MATNYVSEGDVIQYTNAGSAISAGDVVLIGTTGKKTFGVALVDIANGASGSVAVEGVFTCPKVSGAVFKAGEDLLYDLSALAFDDNAATPATGDVRGAMAWVDGANGETTCQVRFTPIAYTVS